MRAAYRRYRLLIVNVVYWFLLLYILAETLWWFIELGRQNERIAQYELRHASAAADVVYREAHMRALSYMGEGCVFLAVLFVGAFYVYRVVRREMRLSHQQQNFMMAVTHELKTPIAVAKLSLETLAKRKLEPEQQAKLIQNALAETDRLNQLSNNILLAAQLEEGRYLPVGEIISLSGLAEQIIHNFDGRFPGRLNASIGPEIELKGDPLLLELAINNLIENALKYSPKDSPVSVDLSAPAGKPVRLTVADLGDGIPEDEKSLIFRKFYRVGNEQTRKTKGTGLGLYLSRAIIRKHRGQITVADNEPRGSVFSITFYT